MPIEREYVFIGVKAYNIQHTIAYLANLYFNDRDGIEQPVFESICAQLSCMKWETPYFGDFMEYPYTGMLIPLSIWMQEFGIEENITGWLVADAQANSALDDGTIGTFTIDSIETDDEECISSEDEEELGIATMIVYDLDGNMDGDLELAQWAADYNSEDTEGMNTFQCDWD